MNDMPDDLVLRRALRALARDEVPTPTLWPRITARLTAATTAVSPVAPGSSPRHATSTRHWPPALAAALLLGVGLGLLLSQMLQSRVPAQRDVAGQRALRIALLQLDQTQASLSAAQRVQPQAGFITEMRIQTALQRAAIQRRLQGS